MVRILHTADWQLGLKLRYVEPEQAARLRAQRFETVRWIAAVAAEHTVDAVVVAGDVFDDNAVGGDTLQQTLDALKGFGGIPVLLLPGNHDPGTSDSALARLGAPESVHVCSEAQPLTIAGATFYPCPLRQRHTHLDPTDWLPERGDDGSIRIAVAHGGALDFGQEVEDLPNLIDVRGILDKGFDYVALGDWHGTFKVDERAWYSGAPEATRFKEQDPGNVLLVEIEAAGATPAITPIRVARTRWIRERRNLLEDAQVGELRGWFESLGELSWTLVELELEGQLSLGGRSDLDRLLEEFSERLALLRVEADRVVTVPTEKDLQALSGEGFVGATIGDLRRQDTVAAQNALQLLHRLVGENGS